MPLNLRSRATDVKVLHVKRPFETGKRANIPRQLARRPIGPPTDVERGVYGSGEVVDVGDPEGLDGHGADAEQQLSGGHERPQLAGVGQTPGLVSAAGGVAGVPLQVADVLTVWRRGDTEKGGGLKVRGKPVTSKCFNFLELVWPFTDSLFFAKPPSTRGWGGKLKRGRGEIVWTNYKPPPSCPPPSPTSTPRLSLISLALRNAER